MHEHAVVSNSPLTFRREHAIVANASVIVSKEENDAADNVAARHRCAVDMCAETFADKYTVDVEHARSFAVDQNDKCADK